MYGTRYIISYSSLKGENNYILSIQKLTNNIILLTSNDMFPQKKKKLNKMQNQRKKSRTYTRGKLNNARKLRPISKDVKS